MESNNGGCWWCLGGEGLGVRGKRRYVGEEEREDEEEAVEEVRLWMLGVVAIVVGWKLRRFGRWTRSMLELRAKVQGRRDAESVGGAVYNTADTGDASSRLGDRGTNINERG